ncbi:hypothetical protein ACTXN4_28565, partial [Pseudomonas helleri]|uniref:hypothetical protein n=1 Tax=Pseudomonas helleri TaxID=1608996 RepID=UPI003FD6A1E1
PCFTRLGKESVNYVLETNKRTLLQSALLYPCLVGSSGVLNNYAELGTSTFHREVKHAATPHP